MEQTISQTTRFAPPATFNPAMIDDNWILENLFGIRTLEKKLERALAAANGKTTAHVQSQMIALKARVAEFDAALEAHSALDLPRVSRVRAS